MPRIEAVGGEGSWTDGAAVANLGVVEILVGLPPLFVIIEGEVSTLTASSKSSTSELDATDDLSCALTGVPPPFYAAAVGNLIN